MAKATSKSGPEKEPQPPTFEEALSRLEEIVEELDDGNVPLARSLELFREGTELAARCRKLLTEAESTLQEVMASAEAPEGEDGMPAEAGADADSDEEAGDDGRYDPFG
jgi:exodeoxyribonuclease VII small subunit